MNKWDLGRQREDRILVAEEEILHEIENQPSTRRLANHLGVSRFVVWLRVQNGSHEIRQNRHSESSSVFFGHVVLKACIANDGRHFEQLLWFFIFLLFLTITLKTSKFVTFSVGLTIKKLCKNSRN
jgi:hypothetical protein